MKAERDGNVIVVTTTANEGAYVKLIPGARFHRTADSHLDKAHWTLRLTWAACVGLRGVTGDKMKLDIGPDLQKWANTEYMTRIAPAMDLRASMQPRVWLPEYEGLRPYQAAGAQFMSVAGSAIIGDEMRLGKTVMTCAAMRELDASPALIICPNSMKIEWARHVERWWPGSQAAVVSGTPKQREGAIEAAHEGDANVLVINWEALRGYTKLASFGSALRVSEKERQDGPLNLIDWKCVVADEAHRGASPRSKQTRALWAVSAGAKHRFALTGTAVPNSVEDIWALGRFVSPDEWPTKTVFLDRYAFTSWNPFGGLEVIGLLPETQDELFKFLDPRFLRRTRAQVLPELPVAEYSYRTVEMTPKQARAYRSMEASMVALLEGAREGQGADVLAAMTPLEKLTRLRQFAAAYGTMSETGELLLTEPSCKIDALSDLVAELGDTPTVVFAGSRQLIELAGARLDKLGKEFGYITGAIDPDDRQVAVDAFQQGRLNLLLCTLGAGGEGLTMDRGEVVVFLQQSYSLREQQQAEARIVGGDGDRNEVIIIQTQGTVETRVGDVLDHKAANAQEVMRDADLLRLITEGR